MTDYTELIKALRYCAESGDFNCNKDCPMYPNYPKCLTKMDMDAAAAIEALEAEVEELKAKKTKLAENSLRFVGEVRELDKRRSQPKLGKWIVHTEVKNIYGGICVECPVCGDHFVVLNVSDEKYCRSCGAKMEVQDGKRCD